MKKVLVKKTAVKPMVRLYDTEEGGSNTNCKVCLPNTNCGCGKNKCCKT